MRIWALAICAALLTTTASAQDRRVEYYSLIGPADRQNSSGAPISDPCAMIQQDRANYHRFGKREQFDQTDPIFADRAMRAQITAACQLGGHEAYVEAALRRGESKYVRVVVELSGSRIVALRFSEGAG